MMLAHKQTLGAFQILKWASGYMSRHQMTTGVQLDLKQLPEHRSLVIEQYGNPIENLKLKVRSPEKVLPKELGPKQVLVEHLVACINPADINLIQGVYGIRPDLPAIVGNEGITRIMKVGSEITHLQAGDHAIGIHPLAGYWQSYSVQDGHSVYKVDRDLDVTVAAQLKVNPCTAYRMLRDFYPLKAGDTVIQNGSNSAVGVYAIQLAKLWGFKTINVIRDRPNREEVVSELKNYGADYVLTEAEISNIEVVGPILKKTGKPKLLLNCVGGKNAIDCQKTLDYGGYSVTYGAMSRQPFSLSAASLIFKRHKFVGFWMSDWYKEREISGRRDISDLLDEVGGLFKQGKLKSKSTTLIDFENRNTAFTGSNNTKYLFAINK